MAVESKTLAKHGRQDGFTLLQVVIVVLVIAVVGGMAVFGIVQARQRIRLTNSARLLASYLEKARVDSIRRHATTLDQMAGITIGEDDRSYTVRIDSDGNGTLDTLNVVLDDGMKFVGHKYLTAFDWRGRFTSTDPTKTKVSYTLEYGVVQRSVDVTHSGDVTIESGEYLDDVPNVNVNSNLSGIDSGSTVNGNNHATPSPYPSPSPNPSSSPAASPTPNPSPTPDASPTPDPSPRPNPSPTPSASPTPISSPTPTPTPAPCVVTATPPSLSIRKHGGVGYLSFTVTGGAGSVSFASGPSNLDVTVLSTNTFRVESNNTSRGDFRLYFSTPCGERQVIVSVTN